MSVNQALLEELDLLHGEARASSAGEKESAAWREEQLRRVPTSPLVSIEDSVGKRFSGAL